MRNKVLVLAMVLAACSDNGGGVRSDAPPFVIPDAPEFAPIITSLSASPTQLTAGVATQVTFTWTYLVTPTFPAPACTIDNGVGPVTSGMPVAVTISQMTLFTLTCTNSAGTAVRQVILTVPPVAPLIGTFTVSPTSVAPNVSTPLTFTWTYSNVPSPAPTCSIDGGTTTITSGTPVNMTLTQARTFRLRCANGVGTPGFTGSTVADVTVAVNECGTAYAQCDAHATCTDTVNSYTCACAANYTGNGDTCSATNIACGTTPALCDTNATCVGTNTCACNAGYVGDGTAGNCTKLKTTFVTSTTGNGLLSSWAGAGANTGLAAADAICQARAAALPNPTNYIAWMSDSANDAFCRVQGLSGKKANNCGLGSLTAAAGPWVRIGDNQPVWPTLDKLVAPSSITYYAANTNESGTELGLAERVLTGTDNTGQYVANATCGDWTSNSSSLTGVAGEVHGGGSSWTQTSATSPLCSGTYHLRCVEKSTGGALPPRHPQVAYKKAFITSVSGNGNLSSWPDSYGQTQYAAADAICQARARYAGYANPSTFKSWLAYPSYINTKITSTAYPYYRPDGVQLQTNRTTMLSNKLLAAWEQTEQNTYLTGNLDAGNVITNIYVSVTTGQYYSSAPCNAWTLASSGYTAYYGRYDLLDGRAYNVVNTVGCDQTTMRFFCVED